MLVKVTTRDLESVTPALASCEGQRISGPIQYKVGVWVEKIPNSLGIFLYETEYPRLIRRMWSSECRFFECEAEGLREPELMLVPFTSRAIEISRGELEVLIGLREPDSVFLFSLRWEFKRVRAEEDKYKILVASKVKLIRELEF